MTVELLNPATLPQPDLYRQIAVATGSRLVFVSGQVARTPDGSAVGAGDLATQTEQAIRNVAAAVEAAGGTFADVAKLTIYIVDWEPNKLAEFGAGVSRAAQALGIDPIKAVTLLGVATLTEPDLLVEIEATAVLP